MIEGLTGPLTRSDIVMIAKAIREKWPMDDAQRGRLVVLLREAASSPTASDRLRTKAREALDLIEATDRSPKPR